MFPFRGHISNGEIRPNDVLTCAFFPTKSSRQVVGDGYFALLTRDGILINVRRAGGTVFPQNGTAGHGVSATVHANCSIGERFHGYDVERVKIRARRRSFGELRIKNFRRYSECFRHVGHASNERDGNGVSWQVTFVIVGGDVQRVGYVDYIEFREIGRISACPLS